MNAQTSQSSVSSDFDVQDTSSEREKHHLEGNIGSGGPLIDLTTRNGGIHIRKDQRCELRSYLRRFECRSLQSRFGKGSCGSTDFDVADTSSERSTIWKAISGPGVRFIDLTTRNGGIHIRKISSSN